ncbi:hypothetical protein DL766_003021 [Monosporascus sp. MC13-8B]|uniref:Uncharacterized protein n=1 Tax=Monosporascus cannonballus TaxID=155416 RepID=A0ABY0HBA5_9PEZI|nr:hypothetical protein DL762_004726 [Monosporascus cannonballus]RYO98777.1 hypothetical protein DL763_002038 [Monosporascus cannonballus]RYP34372.1 hypothetical protein DL766_003021 [Monosporascus sp. MC13-8B]
MPDPEPEGDVPSETGSPRTPPRNGLDRPQILRRKDDTATPEVSPLASPSMSLPSLGMSPLSPLPRQILSPFMDPSSSPRSAGNRLNEQGLMQDGKHVLIRRLNDLAAKLDHGDWGGDESLNRLHAMMDEMESVFSDDGRHRELELGSPKPSRSVPSNPSGDDLAREPQRPEQTIHDQRNALSPAKSPSLSREAGLINHNGETSLGHDDVLSAVDAERVVAEAQNLCRGLEAHIHDLLIMRAERAAQRIIYLERRVQELEDERNENEMEILNLQFQLKAIEVQCLSYVPKDADQDLRESISAWKTEWSALKRKRARKKDYTALESSSSASSRNHHARAAGSTSQRRAPKSPSNAGRLSPSPHI